jgi:D-amino-acid dehydrogenase
MHIIVLGAGVAGVSTAWYLAKAGHQVTVIDRAEAAAMETSFANAGQLSYGYTTPWAAPGIPQKALKWLFRPHSPLIFKPDGSLFQLRWLWQMLANCNAASYHLNKERMVRISEYSRELFANSRPKPVWALKPPSGHGADFPQRRRSGRFGQRCGGARSLRRALSALECR